MVRTVLLWAFGASYLDAAEAGLAEWPRTVVSGIGPARGLERPRAADGGALACVAEDGHACSWGE